MLFVTYAIVITGTSYDLIMRMKMRRYDNASTHLQVASEETRTPNGCQQNGVAVGADDSPDDDTSCGNSTDTALIADSVASLCPRPKPGEKSAPRPCHY